MTPPACIFGQSLAQLQSTSNFAYGATRRYATADYASMGATLLAQVTAATNVAPNNYVGSATNAITTVDGMVFDVASAVERSTGNTYNVVTFRDGGSQYGAIFRAGSSVVKSQINGWMLANCTELR